MNSDHVSLRKYILMYAASYLLCVISAVVFFAVTGIELGHSLELSIVMVSAMVVASKFVQENSRAPSSREKRLLSFACMFVSITISMLAMCLSLLIFSDAEEASEVWAGLAELPFVAWLAIFGFSMLVSYLILSLAFGWFARSTERKLKAKGKLA